MTSLPPTPDGSGASARPPREGQPSPDIQKILGRLGRLRTRIRAIFATIGIGRWLVAAIGILALYFAADYLLDLPLPVRRFVRLGLLQHPAGLSVGLWLPLLLGSGVLLVALTRRRHRAAPLLAFVVGGIAGLLVWLGIRALRPARLGLSDDQLALSVESRFQGLQDRLAGALDFERELRHPTRGESTAMMQHVVHEAAEAARGLHFSQAVSGRRALRWAGLALGSLLLAGLVTTTMPETVGLWARRSLLLQDEAWPRNTHMFAADLQADGSFVEHPATEPYDVPIGRSLTVYARAVGDVPEEAHVLDLIEGEEPLPRRMFRVPGQENVFAYEFLDVRRPFDFILRGGDDDDEIPRYSVEITIPPRVLSIQSEVTYPSYLSQEVSLVDGGTVTVPQGATVKVRFTTDMDIATAEAVVGDKTISCRTSEPGTARSFTFTYEAERSAAGRIVMRTAQGKTNDPAADGFEVRVKTDRPPRVEWTYPRASIGVTPTGRVPLLVEATDDHGIAGLTLEMRVNAEQEVRSIELAPWTAEAEDAAGGSEEQLPRAVTDGAYGRRRVLAYLPIEIARIRTSEGKPLVGSAELTFRLQTRDSRGQVRESELARIEVRPNADLEYALASRRSNVRMSIETVARQQLERRDDIAALTGATLGRAEQDLLKTVRFAQGKIAQDADRAVQDLLTVFNGFVYDRLGSEVPNGKILAILDRYHRSTYGQEPSPSEEPPIRPVGARQDWKGDPVFPYALYQEIVDAWRAKVIYDKGLLDKMCATVADAVDVGARLAPAAHRAATEASSGAPEARDALLAAQNANLAKLDALLDAMRGWQSLSDMTVRLRKIIKDQEELAKQLQGETKRAAGEK
jgi:hypothetical protein